MEKKGGLVKQTKIGMVYSEIIPIGFLHSKRLVSRDVQGLKGTFSWVKDDKPI